MQNKLSEKDMLMDSLMTEKYVSSAYDTAIAESVNQQILQTLQHIQQEEQNHAQLLFEAMNKRGWYTVEAAHLNQAANNQLNQQIINQIKSRMNKIQ